MNILKLSSWNINYYRLLLLAIILFIFSPGCDGQTEAQSPTPGKTGTVQVDFTKYVDLKADKLWKSNRDLAAALVANADQFKKLSGSLAYFRMLYVVEIDGAADVVSALKGGAGGIPESVEQQPEDPLDGINSIDDAYALYGIKALDPVQIWQAMDKVYGGLTPDNIAGVNERKKSASDGGFPKVDHEAALYGIIAVNDLAATSGIDPVKSLLDKYENRWSKLPSEGEEKPDFIKLMSEYDLVSFPYALDVTYMKTGDVRLYGAMRDILSSYVAAVDLEALDAAIPTLKSNPAALQKFCLLARLFRRMYAFLDEESYLEASEGILRLIGEACLTSDAPTAMAYSYALTFVEEPALHVLLVGPSGEPAWAEMEKMSRDRFEPRLALMPLDNERDADVIDEVGYYATDKPSCFVCIDANCFAPISEPEKLGEIYQKSYEEMSKWRLKQLEKEKAGEGETEEVTGE